MKRLYYILIYVLFFPGCMPKHSCDQILSDTFVTTDKTYLIEYGTKSNQLLFVLIQIAPNNKVIEDILKYKVIKTLTRHYYTDIFIKLKDGAIIKLPSTKTQIFQYENEKLLKSKLKISKKQLKMFLSNRNRKNYDINSLKRFVILRSK